MNNRTITIIIIIAIIVLAGVAFALTRNTSPQTDTNQQQNTPDTSQSSDNDTSQNESVTSTIVYTNNGFAKSSITVKAGETIRVQNNSDETFSFNSEEHPNHNDQSALNVGEIAPGESKTFVIDAVGTWGYHNHLNPAHKGEIIVE